MGSEMFGWNLISKSVENDIKKKEDILIAFIHWNLLKNDFLSIGIGDEKELLGNEEKSESLPTGWNTAENYKLRYVRDGKVYILHGLISDGTLIANLIRGDDCAVTTLSLSVSIVAETSGPIEQMLPTFAEVMHQVKRDVIIPIVDPKYKTSTTSTQTKDNLPGANPSVPMSPLVGPSLEWDRSRHDPFNLGRTSPFNYGRSDLDPFSPGGGGMIFNPQRPRPGRSDFGVPGGLPRGAVPPGARFDPFAPPIPGPPLRHPPPDADHLDPFGSDHMFM